MHAFPDFDRDVRRPFAVDEDCYDCAEFYHGCNGCPASTPARCRDRLRLPDVMPGACGQTFPPSRMGGRREPRLCRESAEKKPEPEPAPSIAPARKPRPHHTGPRLCECGVTLPKGKRLCDACRANNHRKTMRDYMRTRRATPPGSDVLSDVPLSATATHATHATADDLPPSGHPAGVGYPAQTSI